MVVNTKEVNPALKALFKNPGQIFFLDANVYELVADNVKQFADKMKSDVPSKLCVYKESVLSEAEKTMYNTYIARLAPHSQYDSVLNNSKDKGEVLSLSYMATKGYIYFGGNDNLPFRLVNQADVLNTGLSNQRIVQSYELLYYSYKTDKYNTKALKALYKYMYRLTKIENKDNPEWGEFVQQMNELYAK